MSIKTGDLFVPTGNRAVSYIDPIDDFPTKTFAQSSDVLIFVGLNIRGGKRTPLAVFMLANGTLVSLYDGEYRLL